MADRFQGKDVHETRIKFTGSAKELLEAPPTIDQIVTVEFEGRVSGVTHKVDEPTGNLIREVTVKVIDVNEVNVLTTPLTVTAPSAQQGAA